MGWIRKIGKRGSPNYYRVYEKNSQIRFELEQSGPKIKLAQKLRIEQLIQKFLSFDENYTDWLIDYFRRQRQNQTKQLIQFFEKIQTMKRFGKVFNNESFPIFPFVKTRKEFGEYGPCRIEVAILQELYFYSYRWVFQPTFLDT